MSKQLYLANVGRTIFMDCANSQIIGMADTLTQATFNLTVQEEELRGGPGNPLLASTFHDQSMELSFTDALISTDMIGAMIGSTGASTGKSTGGIWLKNHDSGFTVDSASQTASVTGVTISEHGPKYGNTSGGGYVVYVRPQGASGQWEVASAAQNGANITITRKAAASFTAGKWCLKYFMEGSTSEGSTDTSFNLNADFVPSVLHSISYIDVYEAGVAGCSGGTGSSTGRAVGQLVIDIPLFQLNNGLNLSLSTTPGTYDISGKALAVETGTCAGNSKSFGTIYYCKTTTE